MAEALKEYYLYLDESGDFEEKRNEKTVPSSLVGGVFGEKNAFTKANEKRAWEFLDKELRGNLWELVQALDPTAIAGKADLQVNHCTELIECANPADGMEVKISARMQVLQWCLEQNWGSMDAMRFVFFRSNAKVAIINSTRTYLNILAEGLAQFMSYLSHQCSAKLTICIGRRVDTADYEKHRNRDTKTPAAEYISEEEYRQIVEERLAIARARYLFDSNNEISYEIVFDSDKKNAFLVLSDYVCSCRYTMDYPGSTIRELYSRPAEDGRPRREVLKEVFQKHSRTFGFLEDQLQQNVRQNLRNQHWGNALYLALAQGEPKQEIEDELKDRFQPSCCSDQSQRTQMIIFFNLVGSLLSLRGSSGDAVVLLNAYLSVLDRLPVGLESLRSFCRVNARLYLATAYTHLGQAGMAKNQLDLCEEALPVLLQQPENLELYYILRNRQAVVWQDCYRYDKALDLLGEAIAMGDLEKESQEHLVGLLVDFSAKRPPSEQHEMPAEGLAPSVQQAKLIGTQVLTYQYILPTHPEYAEAARESAHRAIETMRLPADKRRHHMTLAEIELRCGRLDQAYRQFCTGLGCDPDANPDAVMEALSQCKNPFDWYHAIRLTDGLCWGSEKERQLAQELFSLIHSRFDSVFAQDYPAHSATRRMAVLCLDISRNLKTCKAMGKLAPAYFEKCGKLCSQSGKDTLYAIGLAGLAEQILAELRNGRRAEADRLQQKFRETCAKAESRVQLPELKDFFHQLAVDAGKSEACKGTKEFYQSVSDRVGH